MLYRWPCSPRADCLLNSLCLYQLKYHVAWSNLEMARLIQIKMKFHLKFAPELRKPNDICHSLVRTLKHCAHLNTCRIVWYQPWLENELPCQRPLALPFRWGWDEGTPEPALPQVLVQALDNRREGWWRASCPPLLSRAGVTAAWHGEGAPTDPWCSSIPLPAGKKS